MKEQKGAKRSDSQIKEKNEKSTCQSISTCIYECKCDCMSAP